MLRETYRDYLQAGALPDAAAPLARALEAGPWPEAAELLHHYARGGPGAYPITTGARAGRTAFVGARVPEAPVGSLWFDVVDLTSNLLLPAFIDPDERDDLTPEALERAERETLWFSLRPVSRVQLAGFLDVAKLERVRPGALDPARLLAGPAYEAVTSVMCDEASLYLYWVGKLFAGDLAWLAARAYLDVAPWSTPSREWAGGSPVADGYDLVVSPETLDIDPQDAWDETGARRMHYPETALLEDVTFRGVVRTRLGLRGGPGPTPVGPAGARVLEVFPRP